MDRAYALLTIKSIDVERRQLRGIATTPTPDRIGDIIDPLGATYAAELPLLLHHKSDRPVGVARFKPATKDGIEFDAEIPTILEPGPVKDDVDRAWQSIVHKLIRGVSIGFRVLDDAIKLLPTGGLLFEKTEIVELSLVTIPANQEATLALVKAIDLDTLAATGRHTPGVPGPLPIVRATKGAPAMTTLEKISSFENSRAAKTARMVAIMGTADGATLDAGQTDEYDGLKAEIKAIDEHLVRLHDLEAITVAAAKPIPAAPAAPAPFARVEVKPNVPKGMAFVRAACGLLVCKGNFAEAAEYTRQRWADSTPETSLYLKAAVAAGNTTDATWASPLVNQGIAADFIELLRPATILGKIPGLRDVPFNTKIPAQTAGGSYGWVGEAKPKPVSKLAFSSDSLPVNKVAGIIVLTEELVRLSNPKAEALVRADMIAGIAQFLDQQFIDPAVAAVAGINPASITNGAPTAAATTNPLADIMGLIAHFTTNNIPVDGLTFIMSPGNALSLSFRTNLDGSPEFPGIGIGGGSYRGLNFVTSNTAGASVVALQPAYILYADDGGVTIDASREASLQMDSAPMSPADATTVLVSLWQNNCVGLRAERFITWKRVNANAVKYLTATAWPAPTGAMAPPESPAAARSRS